MTAYPAARTSPSVNFPYTDWHDGWIKLSLGHSAQGSVLVPSLLFAKAGPLRFFQPSFFGPCQLAFNIEVGIYAASLSMDVASPRGSKATRLQLEIKSDQRVRAYEDGAQLYQCRFTGPRHIAPYAAGRCRKLNNDDFALDLFHHTNPTSYASIVASQQLWSSAWNLQGNRRLQNVAYTYFTSLPKISTEEDLRRIAMASAGSIKFQTTSDRTIEEVLELTVYRESTHGRTNSVEVTVPTEVLAPPHLLFHPLTRSNPAYYEIVGPEIYRVGLLPNSTLSIPKRSVIVKTEDLKFFQYIVVGNASELAGLAAPYDEEETKQIMHLEALANSIDFFDFWRNNANSDQTGNRTAEVRLLNPAT